MKRTVVGALVLGSMMVVAIARPADDPKKSDSSSKDDKQKLHALMLRKLDHSQKLLEAITKRNHKAVQEHADALVAITKDPVWKALGTEEYATLTGDFRNNVEMLSQNAKDENYDGASLSYVGVTMSCLNCHKYMRDFK